MKSGSHLTHILGATLGAIVILAACSPVSVVPPGSAEPTASVFLPGVEQARIAASPLQPTAPVSEAASVGPTAVVLPTETPRPTVVGPVWQWVSSTFKDGVVVAPADPASYTFQLLPDGNALVQADCNFGTGAYQETDTGFAFGPIGTTKMACPPDSLDSEFLGQLRNIERYEIDDGGLTIHLLDAAGVMQMRAGEIASLEGAGPTPLPTAAPLAAEPAPTAVATAVVTSAATTAATAAPPTVAPAPTSPAQPTPQLVLSTNLEGASWVLRSLWVGGQEALPVQDTVATLEVAVDGSHVSGSTGCNQYRAMLAVDAAGETLSVTAPAMMTRQPCAANVMVQEVEFIEALLRTRTYAVNDDELTLMDVDGQTLMIFLKR